MEYNIIDVGLYINTVGNNQVCNLFVRIVSVPQTVVSCDVIDAIPVTDHVLRKVALQNSRKLTIVTKYDFGIF